MDCCCTRQPPIPSPEPAPVPTPAAAAPPQEATGDSESDADGPVLTADRSPVADDDDNAESCSGSGSGSGNGKGFRAVSADDGSDEDDVTVEGEDTDDEVDSKMARPWWRRAVVEDAADGEGGGRVPAQAPPECGAVAGAGHAAESNRLFWEACIAHGY